MASKRVARRGVAYLMAGGARKDPAAAARLLGRVLAEVGRAPRVGCVGAANGDAPEFFRRTAALLGDAGAGDVRMAALAADDADPGEARAVLEGSDIVFVAGGDVDAGMRVLAERGMTAYLRDRFAGGTPFLGISAGAIMMATSWVRWPDPDDDASAELFECLGLVPILCDTHAEDEDWHEARVHAGLEAEGRIAYGLCSGSAMRWSPDGTLEVMEGTVARFARSGREVRRLPDLGPGDADRASARRAQ